MAFWNFWKSARPTTASSVIYRPYEVRTVKAAPRAPAEVAPRKVPRAQLRNLRKDPSRTAVILNSRLPSQFDKPKDRAED